MYSLTKYLRIAPLLLALAIVGCGGGDKKPAPPQPATLASLAVTPGNPSAIVGGTVQFVATGTYSDGSSRDITTTVTWSSSALGVATVSAGGLATGVASGSSTITATQSSINGTAGLTVAGPMLSGTAAAGLPLVGNVTVKDSLGATKTVALSTNGGYTIDVGGMRPPLMLRAEGHVGDSDYVLHSAIATVGNGGTVNITPLTDLIIDNVAGQIAASYFDDGSFAGLTTAQLDAESAALKAKLLPVLLAMKVDASIDLLRTPFTPLASALDAALDVIRVSVDPVLNVATITNLVNQVAITDDITTGAAGEANAPTLDGSGMDTTADDLTQIRALFAEFVELYRNGLPTPQAVAPLLADGLLHDDRGRVEFANDLSTFSDLVAGEVAGVVIGRIDYHYGGGTTPLATVSFSLLDRNGVDLGETRDFTVIHASGRWRLNGNQMALDFSDTGVQMSRDVRNGCRASGVYFGVDDNDSSNSASVSSVVVRGPGLPAGGLEYQRATLGGNWQIVNVSGNPYWYPMTASCASWGAAGVPDATIAAIPDNASYEFRAYTSSGVEVPLGAYGARIAKVVRKRPLTLAELNASTAFLNFTTSVDLQTFNGGDITVSGSGADPARTVRTTVSITDGNGAVNGIDADVTPAANGDFSHTFTLSSPAAVTARNVQVGARDEWDRSYDSSAYYVSGFTVGGTIGGLNGSVTLRLNGAYDQTFSAPGPFAFFTPLANGTPYTVTIVGQPAGQVCGPGIANPTGTINGANVTNVGFLCSNYSVGGTVSGLTGAGLVLTLNGANDLAVAASSTSFAFPSSVPLGGGIIYSIEIKTQPAGQTCTIVRPWGVVTAGAPTITNVGLACVDNVTDALSGTYRLTTLDGQDMSAIRPFLTFYPDGTYIFGLHEDDPACGTTGHGGIEYGVYRWNQGTHAFAFVNAVIDTNGICGVTDSSVPPLAGTLVKNPDGTLSSVIPDDDGVSPSSVATFTPVASTAGTLIGSFGTKQFFNVYGADNTIFVADIRSNALVPATSPGIEDGCYLLSGTLTSGSYTADVGGTCAVSGTQMAADTNGAPWGLSQFGISGAWQFTVTGDSAQFVLPGAGAPAALPRIKPN
jgi:Big-like domain-containing protein